MRATVSLVVPAVVAMAIVVGTGAPSAPSAPCSPRVLRIRRGSSPTGSTGCCTRIPVPAASDRGAKGTAIPSRPTTSEGCGPRPRTRRSRFSTRSRCRSRSGSSTGGRGRSATSPPPTFRTAAPEANRRDRPRPPWQSPRCPRRSLPTWSLSCSTSRPGPTRPCARTDRAGTPPARRAAGCRRSR